MKGSLLAVLALAGVMACEGRVAPVPRSAPEAEVKLSSAVPAKVARVLRHIDETGRAPEGYEGGRRFVNAERLLPGEDDQGRRINYQEWDVNPHRPGVNRGPERLVTGSNGSAYYTADHYRTFKRIR